MDMRDLQLIRLLGEEKSLRSVAKRLKVSPSAITQRLDKIENDLGQVLFQRNNDKGFNEAGMVAYHCATKVLSQMEATRNVLGDMKQNKMVLRLMVNPSVAMSDLLDVFEKIKSTTPGFKPHLTEGTTKQIITSVQNRTIDAGIVAGNYDATGIQLTPYRSDRFCVIAPLDHELSQRKEINIETALRYPMVGTTSKQITAFIAQLAKSHNIDINYTSLTSSFELQMAMVAQTSYGIAIVAESLAKRFILTHPIKIIPLTTSFEERQFHLCTPEIGHASDAAILLKQMLVDRFKTY